MARAAVEVTKKYGDSPLAVFIGGVLKKIEDLNPPSSKEKDTALDAMQDLLSFFHGIVLPSFNKEQPPGLGDLIKFGLAYPRSAKDKFLRSTEQYATFKKHEEDLKVGIEKILTKAKKEDDECGSDKFLKLSISSESELTNKVKGFFIRCEYDHPAQDWAQYKAEDIAYEIKSWIFKTKQPENKRFSSEELRLTKEIINNKKTFNLVVHLVTLLKTVPIDDIRVLMPFISPISEEWIHSQVRDKEGFELSDGNAIKYTKTIVDKKTKEKTIKSLDVHAELRWHRDELMHYLFSEICRTYSQHHEGCAELQGIIDSSQEPLARAKAEIQRINSEIEQEILAHRQDCASGNFETLQEIEQEILRLEGLSFDNISSREEYIIKSAQNKAAVDALPKCILDLEAAVPQEEEAAANAAAAAVPVGNILKIYEPSQMIKDKRKTKFNSHVFHAIDKLTRKKQELERIDREKLAAQKPEGRAGELRAFLITLSESTTLLEGKQEKIESDTKRSIEQLAQLQRRIDEDAIEQPKQIGFKELNDLYVYLNKIKLANKKSLSFKYKVFEAIDKIVTFDKFLEYLGCTPGQITECSQYRTDKMGLLTKTPDDKRFIAFKSLLLGRIEANEKWTRGNFASSLQEEIIKYQSEFTENQDLLVKNEQDKLSTEKELAAVDSIISLFTAVESHKEAIASFKGEQNVLLDESVQQLLDIQKRLKTENEVVTTSVSQLINQEVYAGNLAAISSELERTQHQIILAIQSKLSQIVSMKNECSEQKSDTQNPSQRKNLLVKIEPFLNALNPDVIFESMVVTAEQMKQDYTNAFEQAQKWIKEVARRSALVESLEVIDDLKKELDAYALHGDIRLVLLFIEKKRPEYSGTECALNKITVGLIERSSTRKFDANELKDLQEGLAILDEAFNKILASIKCLRNYAVKSTDGAKLTDLADKIELDTRRLHKDIIDQTPEQRKALCLTYQQLTKARLHSDPELMQKHNSVLTNIGEAVVNVLWAVLALCTLGANLAIKYRANKSAFFKLPTETQLTRKTIKDAVDKIANSEPPAPAG